MLLDAQASHAAKLHGQQVALDFSADWGDDVLGELATWCRDRKAQGFTEMTFEQFRAEARAQPKSSKAWGSLPRRALMRGLIAAKVHADGSPVMRAAESVKTHSHPVRVWRIV